MGEKIKTKWEINEIENYSKDKKCKINRILNMINKSKIKMAWRDQNLKISSKSD